MGAGCNVEKHHFIRPLLIITHGEIDRIANIGEFAGFGAAKLAASCHSTVMDVEARNDSAGKHV
jgi:hypothetical protein